MNETERNKVRQLNKDMNGAKYVYVFVFVLKETSWLFSAIGSHPLLFLAHRVNGCLPLPPFKRV